MGESVQKGGLGRRFGYRRCLGRKDSGVLYAVVEYQCGLVHGRRFRGDNDCARQLLRLVQGDRRRTRKELQRLLQADRWPELRGCRRHGDRRTHDLGRNFARFRGRAFGHHLGAGLQDRCSGAVFELSWRTRRLPAQENSRDRLRLVARYQRRRQRQRQKWRPRKRSQCRLWFGRMFRQRQGCHRHGRIQPRRKRSPRARRPVPRKMQDYGTSRQLVLARSHRQRRRRQRIHQHDLPRPLCVHGRRRILACRSFQRPDF